MQRTEKAIEIDAPLERVFDLFSDFENFPRWMSNIKDVHYTGRRFSRWTARAPLGTSVEWEAETLVFEPNRRIAWRTVRGDVNTNGEVIFEPTRRGATLLRVLLGYDPPAGRLGALVASLFGKNPEQQLEEDLHHFADIAEGHMLPPARARHEDERDAPRRDARFDDALRNARRSQQEDERRYQQERGREERERDHERRHESAAFDPARQQRAFDERANEIHREERRWRDEQRRREPETGRYALTPRERAREREIEHERRINNAPEETRKVFRRGVDRLREEGPSSRWRR